ncbi:MAG: chemotaxis protein CheW [Acidobacteria bacterium]|nr:chemotaxis protein CheW [Acidobacteriota bacterium]
MSVDARPSWLAFRLGPERFAVSLERVDEIHAFGDIEPEPGAPSPVCGVLRGTGGRVPVLDLRRRLELADLPVSSRRQRVVAVRAGGRRFGLLVDRVERPIELPPTVVRPLPTIARGERSEEVAGLVALRQGWLILLDVDRLVNAPGLAAEVSGDPRGPVARGADNRVE